VLGALVALPASATVAALASPVAVEPDRGGGAPAVSDDDAPPGSERRRREACALLAATPWPRSPSDRRVLLQRFELARPACMVHAGFLAVLGALWLEEGEPDQALLWLERALLLDPDLLGAQADHALALAALGDPSARAALAARWQQRVDVPPALRERLAMAPAPRPRAARAGDAPAGPQWLLYREMSLVAGHETNLDHSPRLSEITLTLPDGVPQTLPLLEPVVPRRGGAVLGDVSIQLAHSPRTGLVLQAGVLLTARHSPAEPDTDWRHVQLAASASQRWGLWKGQAQFTATDVGGTSNDRYRLLRGGMSAEREALGCSHRLSIEHETRRHQDTPRSDGRSNGLQWNSLCPLVGTTSWTWGVGLRIARDVPPDPERVGGTQHQAGLGLRATGPLPGSMRLDASLRYTRLADRDGYSPLLENGAAREIGQAQFNLELTRPLGAFFGGRGNGTEWVLQLQHTRQGSNLVIFRYQGTSTFSGLRARW
jgi:hypothetical protein